MADGWWTEDYQYGNTNRQTGVAPELMNPNTVYSPPGDMAPIDQYNYTPDPSAPGGYQTYPPGAIAPLDMAQFSNTSGQQPNDQDMAQAISNDIDLTTTVDAQGNATFLDQFNQMSDADRATWQGTYGASAPYQWGIQSGALPPNPEGFNALPQSEQETWYSVYGQDAPLQWMIQSMQNNPAIAAGHPVPTNGPSPIPGGILPNGQRVQGNNWWMQGAIPAQLAYAQSMPGYLPGSMTYNQFRLDEPGLIGTIAGVMSNMQYGSGGAGDPTTGREQQTPDQWVQGGRLFNWTGNMENELGYIGNLFGRSDTPSGIGTPAWFAPPQYWKGLTEQIANGRVQPTNRGWAALAAKGYTPSSVGGSAVQQAASVGVQANGQGANAGGAATPATAGGSTGPMGQGTQAFNYQAAYLDYLTARMNLLEIPGMQNLDERARDELAFQIAKQAWLEKYQQQTFAEGQRQFDTNTGLQVGALTGQYNGQDTLAKQQLNQNTSMDYLKLLSGLRGPGDIFQYLKVLNGTPGGISDIVNAAAGAYRMPTTSGNPTVGGYSNPTNIGTLLDQMNNPNFGSEAQGLNLPAPNQINALALQRMNPSQQQALMGAYEAAGYNPQDVISIFQNSLPQYAQNQGAGRVNLFGR